ncbi:DEAD/DEAH box helicase family protein [Verrucomicrobiota bacterium]
MSIDYTKETDARILIDEQLRRAGWDPSNKAEVLTEVTIRDVVREPSSIYGGEPPSQTATGRADYVLNNSDGHPLAIVEAKRSAFDPYRAKAQALPYAREIGAPFIFLTNGEVIYFWDYKNDDARPVHSFFSQRDLERLVHRSTNRKPLASVEIPDRFIRSGETLKLRPYQKEAMRSLDHAIELGKRRYLIQLPTGTGKTDVVSLYLRRLIEAGRAERILFLVDREQLARQAVEALEDLTGRGCYWLKPGVVRQEKMITVCLLQTMIGRYQDFTSGYFDVVVTDESHRSIYGAWQAALTHFDAIHIGLTATPAMYIERNTYKFYQCKDGEPDFCYPISHAFDEGFLVRPRYASGITEFIAEGAEYDQEHLEPEQYHRTWTNQDTDAKMMEAFDSVANRDYAEVAPGLTEGPGKAIVYAITKNHATHLARLLNERHPEHRGEYAKVITSDVANAQEEIRRFKHEALPAVAVSVDMLTTGFNCLDVIHLVLCRRILSPILIRQIMGRGTRTCPAIGKAAFIVYDFFRNRDLHPALEEEVPPGGSIGGAGERRRKPKPPPKELIELGRDDRWLEGVTYVEVGPGGADHRYTKTDYVSSWEQTIRGAAEDDDTLKKIKAGEDLEPEEEERLAQKLNNPEFFFNEENLRRAYDNQSHGLVDFVKAALGMIKPKSKEEQLTDAFYAWLVTRDLTPAQADYLALLKNRGIVQGKVDMDDLFQPPLSILNAAEVGVELFGEPELKRIIHEMNEEIFEKAG